MYAKACPANPATVTVTPTQDSPSSPISPDEKVIHTRVSGPEPGYVATPIIISQCALTLLNHLYNLQPLLHTKATTQAHVNNPSEILSAKCSCDTLNSQDNRGDSNPRERDNIHMLLYKSESVRCTSRDASRVTVGSPHDSASPASDICFNDTGFSKKTRKEGGSTQHEYRSQSSESSCTHARASVPQGGVYTPGVVFKNTDLIEKLHEARILFQRIN